ncbi:MAG: Protein tyrosine/serine phosphatase/Protein tyrosine/serine phosphatase [Chloroflexi bacterium]|nr:MAG: Protein tyrosine/serine phosphatase/Protein tyrosine/serine phosphatase [Chloroflexota bacterium]
MTTTNDRHLPYDSVFNFRDIGGYATGDGRTIRWRRLFRAGALHTMSASEARHAHEQLGVRGILDLRRPDEIASEGEDLGPLVARVDWRQNFSVIPMPDDPGPGLPGPVSQTLDEAYGRGPSGPRYAAYLERGASQLTSALRLLSQAETYPAVVHCTAGKDRTGVVCALVMNLLGVDDATIVEDYALSNLSTQRLLAMRDVRPEKGEDVQGIYGAPPEAMRVFLVRLRESYGGARGYLRAQGLSEAELDRFAEVLLEE